MFVLSGLIYTPDSLTSVVLSYTILASLVCFSIVVILRKLTIQHVSALEVSAHVTVSDKRKKFVEHNELECEKSSKDAERGKIRNIL